MVLDGRDDHFPGKRQEPLLEAARDGDRPFDQRRDFIEEVASSISAEPPAACAAAATAGANLLAPHAQNPPRPSRLFRRDS